MRHVLLVVIILFGVQVIGSASTTVTPTTTLALETGNNTSAANTFRTQTNGNLGAGNVSKMPLRSLLYEGTTTKTYVHYMGWFGGNNHMNIGYASNDAAQVARQVDDMMSRGIDGAIIDWYGQSSARSEQAAQLLRSESEKRNGRFTFAITEDSGALKTCTTTPGCDLTTQVITDLTYAYQQYENSPAYIRVNGRPAVFFFGMDSVPLDWVRIRAGAPGKPLFIFRNSSAFSKTITDGGYNWVGISATNPNNMGLNNMDGFYSAAMRYPNLIPFGSAYKGFDDSLASWGSNRKVNQQCGQTWLATMAEAGKYYSATRQLANIQVATWNDYEEASEIETGIDNCVTISGAMAGSTLNWGISGQENTIDHYTVFISTDGQNLMPVADVAAGTHTLDLAQYSFAPAQYTIYVKAVGKATILNQMSAAIAFSIANLPPVAKLAVSPTSGIGSVTATANTMGSYDPDGKIVATRIDFGDGSAVSGTLATHTYTTPGSHTVTATVTDDEGASASVTSTVTVAANQPPLARLTASPGAGIAPVTVSASTAASSDPDGTIASSTIDFGDHTVLTGSSASHVYSVAGTYTVTGTVTDNLGATSSATATVIVAANKPPVTQLSLSATTAVAPATITATTSGSTDPDGTIASSTIDFGDHTVLTGSSASHVYSVAGTYTVTGTVTDNLGATSSATATVTVTAPVNKPPVASLSLNTTAVIAPATVTASTSGSSDPDGSIASSTINWGDGTISAGPNASHVYIKAGVFAVTATVTDNKGATSTASSAVTVSYRINIIAPANGATTTASTHVIATASSSLTITAMRIYVDYISVYLVNNASKLDTYITLAKGTHRVVVQSWDSAGVVNKATVFVTVP